MSSSYCDRLQRFVVEHGPAALRDDTEAQQHLIDCADCFEFLEALEQVDATLAHMPEHDAPEAAVHRAMAAVRGARAPETPNAAPTVEERAAQPNRWQQLRMGTRRAFLWLWAGISLTAVRQWLAQPSEKDERPRWRRLLTNPAFVVPAAGVPMVLLVSTTVLLFSRGASRAPERTKGDHFAELTVEAKPSPIAIAPSEIPTGEYNDLSGKGSGSAEPEIQKEEEELSAVGALTMGEGGAADLDAAGGVALKDEEAGARVRRDQPTGSESADVSGFGPPEKQTPAPTSAEPAPVPQDAVAEVSKLTTKPGATAGREVSGLMGRLPPNSLSVGDGSGGLMTKAGAALMRGDVAELKEAVEDEVETEPKSKKRREADKALGQGTEATGPVQSFLQERERTEGLHFQSPDGYWANTYVPGDPDLRLLASRLQRADRQLVGDLSLDRAARQYAQPFDHPTTSALDVFVQADRAGIQGPARMLVQVGLQGTPRRSRSRPAMNVALVLDLSGTPTPESAAAMRALVMALGEARDIGDRFSLVIAGRPGGVVAGADHFKHGPLTVALRSLFAGETNGPSLDLRQAVETAVGLVVGEDDPTTPLGSSAVFLATPNRILPDVLQTLTDMVHESAVNGVPVTVVGVGSGVDLGQLDRLTLAGQGNRRLLSSAAEAVGVVERELSAVSRVIARALRLRIRLAPGVQLVDVIGSHRLGEERAERVRQAEQSIDRRMSRNLGLTSDRGEDEDGIQMVIPSYYAGDTHVILLDVVAPGPGPIADVRVRYKDLVYLKNGVARANLTVHRRQRRPGPLELNVTKNFLAREVSFALRRAADLLYAGNVQAAEGTLLERSALLAGLGREVPGLAGDRDLAVDTTMLAEYAAVLPNAAAGAPRDYVVDSLRFAAFLKVLPQPPYP